MNDIAFRVRTERVRLGLSQTALAGDDFSPSYISLIESGRRTPSDHALHLLAERLDVSPEYLRDGEAAPSEERARLEIGFARLALANGDAESARDRLLEVDLTSLPARHRLDATRALAEAHEMLGEYERSVDLLEPLLDSTLAAGRWTDAALLATSLVATYLEAGDLARSVERGEQVLTAIEGAGLIGTDEHLRLAATLLWSYYERGDLLYARHRADILTGLADQIGTTRGRGSVYWNVALVLEEKGEIVEARRMTERALAYLGDEALGRDVPRLRAHFGWLLLQGDSPEPRRALEELAKARPALSDVGSVSELTRATLTEGRARLLLGDLDAAEANARSVIEGLDTQANLDACVAFILLGDVRAARGDVDGATEAFSWAADRLAMMSAGRAAAAVWRTLGDRLVERGDMAGAVRAFDQALQDVGVRRSSPVTVSVVEPVERGSTT